MEKAADVYCKWKRTNICKVYNLRKCKLTKETGKKEITRKILKENNTQNA